MSDYWTGFYEGFLTGFGVMAFVGCAALTVALVLARRYLRDEDRDAMILPPLGKGKP